LLELLHQLHAANVQAHYLSDCAVTRL